MSSSPTPKTSTWDTEVEPTCPSTFNLSDFPDRELSLFGIEAKHPDDFVLEVLHLAPGAICGAVNGQVATLKNPPRPLADVLDTFQGNGLPRSVARLRELFEVTGPSNR